MDYAYIHSSHNTTLLNLRSAFAKINANIIKDTKIGQ